MAYILDGVIKVTTLRKIVRTPSKIRSLNLTLHWNLVFLFFFFSVMDRIFLAMTEFFCGRNDRKKFAIILVKQLLFSSGDNNTGSYYDLQIMILSVFNTLLSSQHN